MRSIIGLALAGIVLAAPAPQKPKPIGKTGLVEALKIGGLSQEEIVVLIKQRGVDFQLTAPVEAELKGAGAKAELIEAVRQSYRQPETPAAPDKPPAAPDSPPPATPPATGTPAPVTPAAAAPPKAAAPSGPHGPTTLAGVHKLYLEKMPNDLDQFLRAEIARQIGGRITVVLVKEEADAYMSGVGQRGGRGSAITGRLGLHDNTTAAVSIVDKSGKVVIWSSEAGDRTIVIGKGGPRRVAERLVTNLKRALEQP